MKLQQLRYFYAACEHNHISSAAQALHVSQPSVSMAIRELEAEFGVKLIQRRYQGFALTDEGRSLYHMAEGVLRHADQVEQRMADLARRQTPLRIGVPPMAGTTILPRVYGQFLPQHPDIFLTTSETGTKMLLHGLLDNTLDMAFVTHYGPLPPAFKSVPVSYTETAWCAAPDHPLAKLERVRIEQLKDEPLVLFQNSFNIYELVDHRFRQAGLSPNVLHQSGQLSTVYGLIRDGIASGFLMRSVEPFFPGLSWVSVDPPFAAAISLVWERHRAPTRHMTQLIDSFRLPQ